jgi:hypothetical protein
MNNGILKPKSRNEKNNLTILKLKKESNTFDFSLIRKEMINNPKIKSRNIQKDFCKDQQFSKKQSMSSSFQNKIFFHPKQFNDITSSSNSGKCSILYDSIKHKIEAALESNKIDLNNLFSRNNVKQGRKKKVKEDINSINKSNELRKIDASILNNLTPEKLNKKRDYSYERKKNFINKHLIQDLLMKKICNNNSTIKDIKEDENKSKFLEENNMKKGFIININNLNSKALKNDKSNKNCKSSNKLKKIKYIIEDQTLNQSHRIHNENSLIHCCIEIKQERGHKNLHDKPKIKKLKSEKLLDHKNSKLMKIDTSMKLNIVKNKNKI